MDRFGKGGIMPTFVPCIDLRPVLQQILNELDLYLPLVLWVLDHDGQIQRSVAQLCRHVQFRPGAKEHLRGH